MNWRIVKMSGKWYAYPYDELRYEVYAINSFIEQGYVVCLCDDLGTFAAELGIDETEIIDISDDDV